MSKIQWTDITSNPIHLLKSDGSNGGHWCQKISQGCANCYAEAQNNNSWFSFASGLKYEGETPNLILDEQILIDWQKAKTSKKIFVCSMTDLFGSWVSYEWQAKIFDAMLNSNHIFQVLTKRPHNLVSFLERYGKKRLPNIFLGVSTENQFKYHTKTKALAQCLTVMDSKNIHFLSVEPLLKEIDLKLGHEIFVANGCFKKRNEIIKWVIIGGESGNNARPCNILWIQSLVKQCQEYNVPVFVKQLGTNAIDNLGNKIKLKDKKGGDINEFPKDLQIREFPKMILS